MDYAYQNGNLSYDPTDAIHVIYQEARSALVTDEFTQPFVFGSYRIPLIVAHRISKHIWAEFRKTKVPRNRKLKFKQYHSPSKCLDHSNTDIIH
jgi:hypothetical protein